MDSGTVIPSFSPTDQEGLYELDLTDTSPMTTSVHVTESVGASVVVVCSTLVSSCE